MPDVKWIKITVDMFDNRKIKYLRRLENGDSLVLIWVMLLTMAGRCNAGGMIFLTENIPYTPAMLADELGYEESTVAAALTAFERLGMVSTTADSFLQVDGWEDHQNIDGMERIRESKRMAQAKWRAKKKENVSVDSTVDSTEIAERISVDYADKDIDKDKDKDRDREYIYQPSTNNQPGTINEGSCMGALTGPTTTRQRFTPPSADDVRAYATEKGYTIDPEAFVDYYTANGWKVGKNPMKDWRAAVRTWIRKDNEHGRNSDSKRNNLVPENPPIRLNPKYVL